jgi:hypothetical protein
MNLKVEGELGQWSDKEQTNVDRPLNPASFSLHMNSNAAIFLWAIAWCAVRTQLKSIYISLRKASH